MAQDTSSGEHPNEQHPTSSVPQGASSSTAPLTPPQSPPAVVQQQQQQDNASASRVSLSTTRSARSHSKAYMDSLVPPSNEEFARISNVQADRETQQKRRSRDLQRERKSADLPRPDERPKSSHSRGSSHGHRFGLFGQGSGPGPGSGADDAQRAKAAAVIQRTYRGYRTRREMKGLGLNASTRWVQAVREAQFRELTRPRARPGVGDDAVAAGERAHTVLDQPPDENAASRTSTARHNWKKAATIARRAGGDVDADDDESSSSSSSSSSDSSSGDSASSEQREAARKRREEAKAARRKTAKMMGLQYFLEMVDLKHRYGSNLRMYHEEWQKADTNENFFYWLDYGEGRNIDLAACPRERLDREQVRYLSRDERQYYLVQVDAEGRLIWAKNKARIDTTEKWKDSIHGIVPADDPTPAFQPVSGNETRLLGDSSSGESSDSEVSESELEAAQAAKYATDFDNAKGVKKVTHMSASTIFNKLLRKSVRKNTWIFVADTSFRLYVGIKNSGAFQHSSFLQGSRISAAGLIKIKNGRLTSLSPLSGHYRPPASNFRAFVKSLKEEGVDMKHVSISKSYAVLVGLEAYIKTQQKGKSFIKKITHRRDKLVKPEEVARREEDEKDKSQSAAKEREFLEQQRKEEEKEREENRATVQLMQKMRISPRVPAGQKGDNNREEPDADLATVDTNTRLEK